MMGVFELSSHVSFSCVGYAWNRITMELCCDGSSNVKFSGSGIPSFRGYINGRVVDDYSMVPNLQENLTGLFLGPENDGTEAVR